MLGGGHEFAIGDQQLMAAGAVFQHRGVGGGPAVPRGPDLQLDRDGGTRGITQGTKGTTHGTKSTT